MIINMSHRCYGIQERLVVCPLMVANYYMRDLTELTRYRIWYWKQSPQTWIKWKYIRRKRRRTPLFRSVLVW